MGGTIRQIYKKMALTIIPSGTTDKACVVASKCSDCHKNPNEAGTTVVGIDPNNPPNFPPKRSIDKVAKTAMAPASKATNNVFTMGQLTACKEMYRNGIEIESSTTKEHPEPFHNDLFFIQSSSFIFSASIC